MAKLVLRDACYNGIPGVKTKILAVTDEHKQLMKAANLRIEKNRRLLNSRGVY